jgi:hypothetical protein
MMQSKTNVTQNRTNTISKTAPPAATWIKRFSLAMPGIELVAGVGAGIFFISEEEIFIPDIAYFSYG